MCGSQRAQVEIVRDLPSSVKLRYRLYCGGTAIEPRKTRRIKVLYKGAGQMTVVASTSWVEWSGRREKRQTVSAGPEYWYQQHVLVFASKQHPTQRVAQPG